MTIQQVTDKTEIVDDIKKILESLGYEDSFAHQLGPDTCFSADLEMKSIDVAKLIGGIQKKYNKYDFPFEELFLLNDRPADDLSIMELAEFLFSKRNG